MKVATRSLNSGGSCSSCCSDSARPCVICTSLPRRYRVTVLTRSTLILCFVVAWVWVTTLEREDRPLPHLSVAAYLVSSRGSHETHRCLSDHHPPGVYLR